jgi:hypothetical protein
VNIPSDDGAVFVAGVGPVIRGPRVGVGAKGGFSCCDVETSVGAAKVCWAGGFFAEFDDANKLLVNVPIYEDAGSGVPGTNI